MLLMLDRLERVDWSGLQHAYGQASDVPALLRALVSSEKETRDEALYELYGNIWHQGTVYQATAFAVPFLIEILAAKCDKPAILRFLAHLANGSSYLAVHKPRETSEQVRQELGWVRDTTAAVRAGTPIYLGMLAHADSRVRESAAFLLGRIPGEGLVDPDELWNRGLTETDVGVKFSLMMAATSRGNIKQAAGTLEQEPAIRLALALAVVKCNPQTIPEEASDSILEALSGKRSWTELDGSPWLDGDTIANFIEEFLLGLEIDESLLDTLGRSLSSEKTLQALTIVRLLINLVFPHPLQPATQFSDLTNCQQKVLKYLCEADPLWTNSFGSGHCRELADTRQRMSQLGLPTHKRDFWRYVFGPGPMPSQDWLAKVKRVFGLKSK